MTRQCRVCINDELLATSEHELVVAKKKQQQHQQQQHQVEFNNFLDNSVSYFERYAKTIENVDTILMQDRIQQKLYVERIINFVQIKSEDSNKIKFFFNIFKLNNQITVNSSEVYRGQWGRKFLKYLKNFELLTTVYIAKVYGNSFLV